MKTNFLENNFTNYSGEYKVFELIIGGLHLRCNKAMINSFTAQQFLVRALLHHAPVMNDSYDVSILDGG